MDTRRMLLRRAMCCCACVQLANVLSTEALFYACIFPFIAFFGSFAFVLYPLRDVLHPTGDARNSFLLCTRVCFQRASMWELSLQHS